MNWVPFAQAFKDPSMVRLLRILTPNLLVDADAIKNQPTATDPLGAKSPLVLEIRNEHGMGNFSLSVSLFGEQSPYLDGITMEVYLSVEYPAVFRRSS